MIVGAGIGGSCAAVALRRAGFDTVVYERSEDLRTFGGGFELWINGVRAVRSLGLAEQAEAIGHQVQVGEAVTWRGRVLAEWPVGELSKRLGAPVLGVSRPDLHRMFVEALDDGAVVTGADCTGFRTNGNGIEVTFADGRTDSADVLIGADGLHSVIRTQLLGAEPPRYAGYTVWRAMLDFEHELAPNGLFRLHWGRGTRFLFFRVGPARMYWSAMVKTTPGGVDEPGGHRQAVLHHFRGFVEPIEAMIEATDEAAIIRQDIYDRDPAEHWGTGRVTLLGDAAHPMSPDQGQGANQAIEDGVVLAQHLSQDSGEAGLRAYEAQRIPRTREFVRNSRILASLGLRENPTVCAIRDQATKTFNPVFWRRLQKAMDVDF